MTKKTKKILLLLVGAVALFFGYQKFFGSDKFGKRMSLDGSATENVVYNGAKIGGYIQPGTLSVKNGLWTGKTREGNWTSYTGFGWVNL